MDTGTRIESAADLCYRCLDDVATDVLYKMCIRDSHKSLVYKGALIHRRRCCAPCRGRCVPVSYTHLDVYKRQLKEHRPILYNQLLMSEKLYPHLLEIDRTAQERVETMLPHMMETAGVTEELKACDPISISSLTMYKWTYTQNNFYLMFFTKFYKVTNIK